MGICVLVTLLYSGLSGLWGVVVTDFLQFFIAMVGSIALAYFAVDAVGGITGLQTQLNAIYGESHQILNFTPVIGSVWMPVSAFCVYLAVNWWAAWYPGAEPGGGGYIAQRMFATKNERHSLLATLWFNIAHYALRPWPWILVALTSLVLYPDITDKQTGHILVMLNYLPTGFKGLMLAAFAAAYMSTISTQLNWGSSYLINDFYKRFIKTDGDDKHYVKAARLATVLLVILMAVVTSNMNSIAGAWKFLLALGAGTGSVYILRWFWWRINAWSEISAMIASFIISTVLQTFFGWDTADPHTFATMMIVTVVGSTFVWLIVTFLTAPVEENVLVAFFRKTRPGGMGWQQIAALAPDVKADTGLLRDFADWAAGITMVYCTLFGLGKLILGDYLLAIGLFFIAIAGFAFIMFDLNSRNWEALK